MPAMHMLGVVSWDPQLRGALILLVGALVLPGSVLLLLTTNLGARLAVLIAAAGLSGLLLLLNVIWLMAPLGTGPIGYKGSASGWIVKEIVAGRPGHQLGRPRRRRPAGQAQRPSSPTAGRSSRPAPPSWPAPRPRPTRR